MLNVVRSYVTISTELNSFVDIGNWMFPQQFTLKVDVMRVACWANPLQALSEWTRVLREEGLLVLVIPHKDGTFDHRRPVTSLAHLIQDFEQQVTEADLTHLEEILRLHDLTKDTGEGDFESFRQRSIKNLDNRRLHHHVSNTSLAVEVIHHIGLQILAVEAI